MSSEHKTPKKKDSSIKKKSLSIKRIKRPLVASSLAAIATVAGILGGIYILNIEQEEGDTLIIGMSVGINSLDPLYNPDNMHFRDNRRVWSQIIEGLFEHNQSREDTPIIPCLAKDLGNWSSDGLNFTIPLKEGVKFHDGTPFNAAAVKWNIERIYRFVDIKPGGDRWVWTYMYFLQDGSGRPIVNETIVIDEYTVRFVLNSPYAPFRALLATASILSPSSTPENDYVDKFNDKLIGTGPFKLESYHMDPIDEICRNMTVTANRDYWGGQPKIEKVHFQVFRDSDRLEKILSGDIHYTPAGLWSADPDLIEACKNKTSVDVVALNGLGVYSICMNYDLFPLEMRKAMSYAFNYSDYITTLYGDLAFRAKSPLPKGTLYSNWDLNVANTNLSVARQTLINATWPGTSTLTANDNVSTGNEWEKLVDDGTPLATYNFSMISGSSFHESQSILLTKYFKQIGIKLNQNNLTPSEHEEKLLGGGMEFYALGWGLAFNDPIEMLNPLFSENSPFNNYNFSDTQVEDWLNQGIVEFNETARKQIYSNIQKRLVEKLYPMIWTHSVPFWEIWSSDIKGIAVEGAPFKFILKYASLEES